MGKIYALICQPLVCSTGRMACNRADWTRIKLYFPLAHTNKRDKRSSLFHSQLRLHWEYTCRRLVWNLGERIRGYGREEVCVRPGWSNKKHHQCCVSAMGPEQIELRSPKFNPASLFVCFAAQLFKLCGQRSDLKKRIALVAPSLALGNLSVKVVHWTMNIAYSTFVQ